MNQFSIRWILTLNWLCQNWGQVHTVRTIYDSVQYDTGSLSDYVAREWRSADKSGQESNVKIASMIAALLAGGADPNLPLKPDGDGGSILAYAVKNCPSDVPRLLIFHKARVDNAAINAARFDLKVLLRSHAGGSQ